MCLYLSAKLDTIALLISDFFLATFAIINFSTFHISLVKPIGWRPTFKALNFFFTFNVHLSEPYFHSLNYSVLQHLAESSYGNNVHRRYDPRQSAGGDDNNSLRSLLLSGGALPKTTYNYLGHGNFKIKLVTALIS